MSLLASWIQQLIVAVILATLLDLLLPNNTMQRYVRFVMGLMILTIILSPLFSLLKNDWSPEQWFALSDEVSGELESLSEIEHKVENLNKVQEALIRENVQSRMERALGEAVERQFAVTVSDATVLLSGEQIDRVTLNAVRSQLKAPSAGSTPEVEEVRRVEIAIPEKKEETSGRGKIDRPLAQKIQRWIASQWELDETKVRVTVAEAEG